MVDRHLAQELTKSYSSAVPVVKIKIRDLGEVKKFDAGEARACNWGSRAARCSWRFNLWGSILRSPSSDAFFPAWACEVDDCQEGQQ